MSVEKHIGSSPMLEEPKKQFNFVLKEGAVTTEKIADDAVTGKKIGTGQVWNKHILPWAVTLDKIGPDLRTWIINQAQAESEKIPEGLPAQVQDIADALTQDEGTLTDHINNTSIHLEAEDRAKIALIQNIMSNVSILQDTIVALTTRVAALENIINPPADDSWYIGQTSKTWAQFDEMSLDALTACCTKHQLSNTTVSFTINESIWFALIPATMKVVHAEYTSAAGTSNFNAEDVLAWQENYTRDSVMIEGVKYDIYASRNVGLVNSNAPAQFIITSK